jgi:hypothetical protein
MWALLRQSRRFSSTSCPAGSRCSPTRPCTSSPSQRYARAAGRSAARAFWAPHWRVVICGLACVHFVTRVRACVCATSQQIVAQRDVEFACHVDERLGCAHARAHTPHLRARVRLCHSASHTPSVPSHFSLFSF